MTLRDDLPSLAYHFRQDAREQLQRTLLGKTLLFIDAELFGNGAAFAPRTASTSQRE